jgi:hypothetical protein
VKAEHVARLDDDIVRRDAADSADVAAMPPSIDRRVIFVLALRIVFLLVFHTTERTFLVDGTMPSDVVSCQQRASWGGDRCR